MKRLLILISIMALALTLTIALSGCAGSTDDFEGKNIVTFHVNGGILNYGTSSTKTSANFVYEPGTYVLDPSKDIPNYSIPEADTTLPVGIPMKLVHLLPSGILQLPLMFPPLHFMQVGRKQSDTLTRFTMYTKTTELP